MIQKAIDILKLRKSDAILVIVIMVICHASRSMMTPLLSLLGPKALIVTGLITMPISLLLIIVPIIFSLGFYRLTIFCSESPHKLCEYFSVGYKYFWKVFGFMLSLTLLCLVLAVSLAIVLSTFLDLDFYIIVSEIAPYLILLFAKYLYFIPAQIVVYNRSIFESVSKIKHFRGKEINFFIGLCLALRIIMLIISNVVCHFMTHYSVSHIIATICQIVVGTIVLFLLDLIAVLYVHRQFMAEQVLE